MAKIAALVGEKFEDTEYAKPAEAFRQAGNEVIIVGVEAGKDIAGERGMVKIKADRAVNEVSVDDFDALFIPGGYSPDKLRIHEEAVNFVRDFVNSGKPVFAICHAPQLLITAQVIKGRKVAGWKSIIQDIRNAGATYVDREAVVDGNLVSSRGPRDIPAFIDASLKMLGQVPAAAR